MASAMPRGSLFLERVVCACEHERLGLWQLTQALLLDLLHRLTSMAN